MTATLIAVLFLIASCNLGTRPSHAVAAEPLPSVFIPVLAEIKAKTNIPLLLPTELPKPFSDAEHAVVGKAKPDEYSVILYYDLDAGNAGFAASFMADNKISHAPLEFGNVRRVKLAGRNVGFFRPVSCGGSCAPANLWWEQGTVLYAIQLSFPSSLNEKKQKDVITKVVNSAILAGPR